MPIFPKTEIALVCGCGRYELNLLHASITLLVALWIARTGG